MGKYTLKIDRDRLLESRERVKAYYTGQAVDRVPFCYRVTDGANLPHYTFRELIADPDKVIENTIAMVNNQFEQYPDTDFLPGLDFAYLGEGLIPSMFGAEQYIVDDQPPFTNGRIMKSIEDVYRLPKHIDPANDGWGTLLKETVEKFLHACNEEIPVFCCDHQSPYGVATKMLGNEDLMYAMYDEPEAVHALLDIAATAIEDTIDAIEKWAGTRNFSKNHHASIPGCREVGLIVWDDYISVLSPELHKEFCKPYNIRLFERYGYGHLHTCGPYFPGFIDACVECKPRSLDIAIMRGMARSREDILEFRRITRENDIMIVGWPDVSSSHIFESKWETVDDEFLTEMARGRWLAVKAGPAKDAAAETERFRRIVKNAGNSV